MKEKSHHLKICLLSLVMVLSTTAIQAQESFTKAKGTYFANGSVLINTTTHNINDNKATSFGIAFGPKLGYFIKENLAIGAEIQLKSSKEKQEGTGGVETSTFGIGFLPLARYYFANGLFGEAGVVVSSQKTKGGSTLFGDNEYKAMGFGFRLGAGYAIHLAKNVAIEPGIYYSWESFKPNDAPSSYKESLSSLFLSIGITAFF